VDTDLDRLKKEMDVVAEYWRGIDTELQDIETRVKVLRKDHMLQMRIRGLGRDWKGVVQDQKSYINAVSAIPTCTNPVLTLFQLNTLLNNNPQYKEVVIRRAIAPRQDA
jgi:hypothetical protein